MNAVS
jgi:hypothetical protein